MFEILIEIGAGVGKSCLLLRFSDGSFTTSFITTIGFVSLGTPETLNFETILVSFVYWNLEEESRLNIVWTGKYGLHCRIKDDSHLFHFYCIGENFRRY